jgi:ABC-2 type transport system ATP-binding protein
MTAAVVIQDLVKTYRGSPDRAVDGLTLTIPRGEIYGLLGPNGAGKSSTVMMLCGLRKPDSGSISVFGYNPVTDGDAVRSKVGVATQDIALFSSLTATENLDYLSHMYGLKPDKKRVAELLEVFGLSSKARERVSTFSGGMKRRLHIAVSLLHQPDLLILDEPTTGVDVQSRSQILTYIQQLNTQGMTVIYSTHILEEAERICHRVGVMHSGQLITEGTVAALKARHHADSLEDVFLALTGIKIQE